MGLIFDEKAAEMYQSWSRSSQGQAADDAVERLVFTLLRPHPGERVLDIGSGLGDHLLMFSRLGLDITGIDASPHMILRAGERLGRHCTLKPGFAEDLPFEDNEFDLAALIFTLEFVDDPLETLREAGRVARRRVFIGVMNGLSIQGLQKWCQGCLGNRLFRRARFYNLWQLKGLLRSAYGESPTVWACAPVSGDAVRKDSAGVTTHPLHRNPFGFLLGISVTPRYTVMTDNLPLKIAIKQTRESLAGVKSFQDVNMDKGFRIHERGISI
jgi:ubiquinone/menaquinone biosynthesis C-methylase UbiE